MLQYKIFVASLLKKDLSELNEVKNLCYKKIWFLRNDGNKLGI